MVHGWEWVCFLLLLVQAEYIGLLIITVILLYLAIEKENMSVYMPPTVVNLLMLVAVEGCVCTSSQRLGNLTVAFGSWANI